MFCNKCGATASEGTRFCQKCGNPLVESAPSSAHFSTPAPTTTPTSAAPFGLAPLGQKWYKALSLFVLFATAIFYFYMGVMFASGNIHGGDMDKFFVYYVSPALQAVDIISGVILFGLAAFAVVVRFRLAAFRSNTPSLLNMVYGGAASVSVIRLFGGAFTGADFESLHFGFILFNLIISIIFVAVNTAYFKKRLHMFVK